MQNNLDKYFKENLDHRQFEMKDAYWEQAQKLLEEDEKKRRRRIIGWWSGGIFAVLFLMIGAYYFKPYGKSKQQISQELNRNIVDTKNNSGESNKAGNIQEKLESEMGEKTSLKADAEIVVREDIFKNVESKNIKKEKQKIDSKKIKASAQDEIVLSENKLIPSREVNDKLIIEFKEELSIQADLNEINKSEIIVENEPVEVEEIETEKPSELAEIDVPEKIDGLVIFVENKKEEAGLETLQTGKDNEGKMSFGFTAGQFFQATPRSTEQAAVMFQAGAVVKYDLQKEKGIYLLSGLNYQRRTGTFVQSKIAETRNYRFGLELETNMLRPTSAHILSLPILLGKEKKRHAIEAGVSVDNLLGVQGERGSFDRIPDSDPPMRGFVPAESGWIKEDGFKKWTSTAQLNYRFRVNTQWSFGLSANYTFGGILRETNPNLLVDGVFVLKEDDAFLVGLKAMYLFK